MKKIFFTTLALMLTFPVIAKEVWQGEFTPPSKANTTRGHRPDIAIAVLVNVSHMDHGNIDGTVTLTGHQLRCYGEAKIESGRINGKSIRIATEPLPVHSCGRFIFEGEISSDEWIGKVPWNGASNDLVLKKK